MAPFRVDYCSPTDRNKAAARLLRGPKKIILFFLGAQHHCHSWLRKAQLE
jgi:hypothetical protein